ncbi:MAG: xylose isomerase [Bacteroidia bacterium]|nr:xylose isomerase [Bacteroidia bacterium]
MIYISTSAFNFKFISESIIVLAENGYINIELSGGTKYYENMLNDLIFLREKYNLNYLIHNYFPPPKKPFVINLASLNDEVYKKSLEQLINSINMSKKLSLNRFSFHAGFLVDIATTEIGKVINPKLLFDKEESLARFCNGYYLLEKEANGEIELYIENNVCSQFNFNKFNKYNPFLLTDYNSYIELKSYIDFKLLLDIAHLKVSCNTLNLDLKNELTNLICESDYLHFSDNNSITDSNKPIERNSELFDLLLVFNLKNKTISLEINQNIDELKNTYDLISNIIQ